MASGSRPIEWPTRDAQPEGAVRITSRTDESSLSIHDGIERRRRVLGTEMPVTPVGVTSEAVPVPVDAASLSSVGVAAFFLNGCRSYRQGAPLIEAGAVGGEVTLGDVINSGAVWMGGALARLLDAGSTLRSALSVARFESIVGGQYTVVGDGSFTLRQADGGVPFSCSVETHGARFLLEVTSHPTRSHSMGSLIKPHVDSVRENYLLDGSLGIFHVSREELASFFSMADIPLSIDGRMRWSDDVSISEL